MFPNDVVELANKFTDLQNKIFQLNSGNMISIKAYFSSYDPGFISHYLPQIAHYFYFATIIRQDNVELYINLFQYLISQGNEENELSNLPLYYLDNVFQPPPSKNDVTVKIGPISFLRRLYEESVYTIDTIIDRIEEFQIKYPKHGNAFLLYFCWFIPEIEQKRTELYSKTLSMFDSKQLLMFPYYFVNFFRQLEEIRADDWKLFHFLTANRYRASTIEYVISKDDATSLQIKLNGLSDLNEYRIDCSVFETEFILQNRPTLLQFSIAHKSERCTKLLILNHARMEEHMYERYPTSHFAISSENELILHKLEQEKGNFNGSLNIAAFYHREDVFEWLSSTLFQSPNKDDFDFGPLIHSCIATENYSVILHCIEKGININQRDRTKKTFLFEAARSNHQDIVELILSHPDINVNLHAVFLFFIILYRVLFLIFFLIKFQIYFLVFIMLHH